MIPFIGAEQFVNLVSGQQALRQELNADFAFLTAQRRASGTRGGGAGLLGWPARLLRDHAAKRAARQHEEALIKLWDVSPHLLEDIGVVDAPNAALPDHLVAAPSRVAEHIRAQKAQAAAETLMILPAEAPEAKAEGSGIRVPAGLLPFARFSALPA